MTSAMALPTGYMVPPLTAVPIVRIFRVFSEEFWEAGGGKEPAAEAQPETLSMQPNRERVRKRLRNCFFMVSPDVLFVNVS